MIKQTNFSYPSLPIKTVVEPNIPLDEVCKFTDTWYACDIHLSHYVRYGKITEIKDNIITIKNYNYENSMYAFPYFEIREEGLYASNFSGLRVGQEVVLSGYNYNNLKNDQLINYMGICDKDRFEHAVRSSQMLPKGWLHEPYYTVDVRRGTMLYQVDDSGDHLARPYMRPDDMPNTQYLINDKGTFINGNILTGDRIVELIFTIILPDDKIEVQKVIYDEKIYDSRVNKNSEGGSEKTI